MTMKGRKQSEETKEKIRKALRGKKMPWAGKYKHGPLSKKHKENISRSLVGRPVSVETREKIRRKLMGHPGIKGSKNVRWRGGVTPLYTKIRNSPEYKLWRKAVFERDHYRCIWCGDDRGGNLNADHIKPFALFPELRFAIDNGRTLCVPCHKTTESYGRNLKEKEKSGQVGKT